MAGRLQSKRWAAFRRRAEYSPEKVYRHRTRGWEYIPIHPFGDEPELLARLGLRPEDCGGTDVWWGIDGDPALLESWVVGLSTRPAGLLAAASGHRNHSVRLQAVFDSPFVTRAEFEVAMARFAEAGFPLAPQFRLRRGDPDIHPSERMLSGPPALAPLACTRERGGG